MLSAILTDVACCRPRQFDDHLIASSIVRGKNALALLQTIPGIDRIGAAMLLVEIGTTMALFAGPDHLASWAGLCRATTRAPQRKRERQRKGNSYVRRLFCEFAPPPARPARPFGPSTKR